MSRERLVTLPNAVSMSRLLLAAMFVAVRDPVLRFSLLLIASGTDFLDGWLARRAKWTTRWGALIDPIADRVFALVAILTFIVTRALSPWQALVMLSRDIMTAVGFIVARLVPWLRPVQFKARMSGKVVTVLQFATFIALLRFPQWVTLGLWLVGLTSVYSIVDYTLALWRARAR